MRYELHCPRISIVNYDNFRRLLVVFQLKSPTKQYENFIFGVFINSFRGLNEVRVVLSQHFPLIFRFILAISVSIYVIFVSFSILFHGNSAFFMNLREVRKLRARTVPAFFLDFQVYRDYFCEYLHHFCEYLRYLCEFFHFISWKF